MKSKQKKHGEGNNTYPHVFPKSNNNERKVLTHHEIHNCRKLVSVTTQVCKETKLLIHSNLQTPNISFTYSFKFTYFCIVDIWALKKGFCYIR